MKKTILKQNYENFYAIIKFMKTGLKPMIGSKATTQLGNPWMFTPVNAAGSSCDNLGGSISVNAANLIIGAFMMKLWGARGRTSTT
ncbi:hypothetical protein Tco_0459925 [Tanacetum coccineum]